MKSQIYVGYKLNPMEVISTPIFNNIGDRAVVLDNDAERLSTQLDTISNSPSHPYMLKTLTIPEMTIISHYTFEDRDNKYSDITKYPQSSSLSRIRQDVRGNLADETVIQLAGDDIHCGIEIRFDKYQAPQDMYLKMRNIALGRGELLAEYQRALQRFPNTEGVKEWYQTIAAADPNKDRHLYEGHYIEHYVHALEQCREQMPRHTPEFMLVSNAIMQAAKQLSTSIDDTTALLFKGVREVAEDTLAEGYREWCQSMHPDTYLSNTLKTLPDDTHEHVTHLFTNHIRAGAHDNPHKSLASLSAIAMQSAIEQCTKDLQEASMRKRPGFHGRIPSSLDIECFQKASADVAVTKDEMSVVSWYGGDAKDEHWSSIDYAR